MRCEGLSWLMRREHMCSLARVSSWSVALVLVVGLLLVVPSLTAAQDVQPAVPMEGPKAVEPQADTPKPEPQVEGPKAQPQAEPSQTPTQAETTKVEVQAEGKKPETRAINPKTGEPFPEKFMIRGGYNYIFNADTKFSINGPRNIGATVNYADQLGGQREDSLYKIDSLYRFNPRHSIGFSFYDVRRKGNRALDRDVTIDDVTYAAGGNIQSELNFKMYRFLYNYSFHHDEKVELGLSGGIYLADIQAKFNSSLTCTGGATCGTGTTFTPNGTSSSFTIPLPTIGLFFNYNITPRLQSQVRFDWFYIETAQFKGAMTEAYLGLEYRLFKNFGLGAAFDRLSVQTDIDRKKGGGYSFDNDWNTVFLYGSLYF